MDSTEGPKLHLFEFDGTPVAPLFQVVRPLPALCARDLWMLILLCRAPRQTCCPRRCSVTSLSPTLAPVPPCSTRSVASGISSSASPAFKRLIIVITAPSEYERVDVARRGKKIEVVVAS